MAKVECGNCEQCRHWRYEFNIALQSDEERDGFGVCESIENQKENPLRAMARLDDDFAHFQTRREFGCVMFEAR